MSKNHLSIAEAYYTSVGKKNIADIEKYLHPEIHFISPLDEITGQKAVLEATKNFAAIIKSLKIRAKFSSEDQTMMVYDAAFPEPIGNLRGASLMTFKDGLIVKIELFYDSHPIVQMKEQIFS